MKEITVKNYEAFDGTRFKSVDECRSYEKQPSLANKVLSEEYLDVLRNVMRLCKSKIDTGCDCDEGWKCPFFVESRECCALEDTPIDWKIV